MSSKSELLAEWVCSLGASDLTESVKLKAGHCCVDYLAAAWNASGHELADAYTNYAESMAGAGGPARVIGSAQGHAGLPPVWAVFANAARGHVTEVDDGHRLSIMHIGTVVLPVVLALGQSRGLPGSTMLAAAVCGYDLAIRVGECLGPEHYGICHTTGTAGTFGAAAAAARCLELSPQATAWALGHAGTQAAGLWQFLQDGAVRAKPLHPAKAAQNGLQAACLAEAGIEGALRIFEGDKGFCALAAPKPDHEKLIRDLGRVFKIEEVNFKGYPTCGQTHSMLDALESLMRSEGVRAEDVESVEARVYRRAIDIAGIPEPSTLEDAKFSNQFCLAFMLVRGALTFSNFTVDALCDDAVREMSRRVSLVFDPEMDAGFPASRPCRVVVRCRDGRVLSRENRFRKGDPENPMDTAAMADKFASLAGHLLSGAQRAAIVEWCQDLERRAGAEDFLFHVNNSL